MLSSYDKPWNYITENEQEKMFLVSATAIVKKRLRKQMQTLFRHHNKLQEVLTKLPSVYMVDLWLSLRNTSPQLIFHAVLADIISNPRESYDGENLRALAYPSYKRFIVKERIELNDKL